MERQTKEREEKIAKLKAGCRPWDSPRADRSRDQKGLRLLLHYVRRRVVTETVCRTAFSAVRKRKQERGTPTGCDETEHVGCPATVESAHVARRQCPMRSTVV